MNLIYDHISSFDFEAWKSINLNLWDGYYFHNVDHKRIEDPKEKEEVHDQSEFEATQPRSIASPQFRNDQETSHFEKRMQFPNGC